MVFDATPILVKSTYGLLPYERNTSYGVCRNLCRTITPSALYDYISERCVVGHHYAHSIRIMRVRHHGTHSYIPTVGVGLDLYLFVEAISLLLK